METEGDTRCVSTGREPCGVLTARPGRGPGGLPVSTFGWSLGQGDSASEELDARPVPLASWPSVPL